ncbi:hypothetical protein LTR36_005699 [Oleoguttula mirabilis]|uniref:SnoaL-like domain-containing protein n=1 Tax=Oleoguttula mirabilis TaxID=1507867 RepID=A0AAV9JF08_9PEZI|nr:hypothetical protein LTR36_005699 [Oleoguttula mirabilis]
MDNSPLATLSAEIRNIFYELAFRNDDNKTLDLFAGDAALSRTCRQIRQESLLLYYAVNTFKAEIPAGGEKELARRVDGLDHAKLRHIRKLHVFYNVTMMDCGGAGLDQGPLLVCNALAAKRLKDEQIVWEIDALSVPRLRRDQAARNVRVTLARMDGDTSFELGMVVDLHGALDDLQREMEWWWSVRWKD